MTMEQVGKAAMTDEDAVWCTWFDKVGSRRVVQRGTFPPFTLVKVETSTVGPMVV